MSVIKEFYTYVTKKTFNNISEEYIKRDQIVVDESIDVKKALEKFASLVPKEGKVLDIGSGGGRDSRFLANYGLKITAIDFSEKMIEGAKAIQSNIDYQVMDFERISFEDNQFDGVWANASLHHIPKANLSNVLTKIHGILKDHGTFFIKVKCGEADSLRENKKFGHKLTRYFAFYKPKELEQLITTAGFTILNTEITTAGEWVDIFCKK